MLLLAMSSRLGFTLAMLCSASLHCHAQVKTCHTYTGKFTDGICASKSFAFKRCADPLNLNVEEIVKIESDKSATYYTEAICESNAKNIDADILAPG